MDSIANNSKVVIRAADISTAPLPTRISNLRRLVTGVQRAPKFPRGGAEICQKLHFRPKVARSSELVCRERVLDVGERCRGGLRNFAPPPSYWGPRLDSEHAKCLDFVTLSCYTYKGLNIAHRRPDI